MKSKYPKKFELEQVFEIDSNYTIWRRPYIDIRGYNRSRQKVTNKCNSVAGYCDVKFKDRILKYHTILWIMINGDIPEGYVIDHIDGNRVNNDISNLRCVTQRTNMQNMQKHRNGKLVGCYYNKRMKKWHTQITVNNKRIHIGHFNSQQEAHEAFLNYMKDNL